METQIAPLLAPSVHHWIPSGKSTVCELENGPFIVDLPIRMVIFHSYAGLVV